jgi:myosin X
VQVLEYKDIPIGELPPHIYALANEAYFSLWKKDRNQVMLISGESGAGKTESTKHILQFLSYLSNQVAQAKGHAPGGAVATSSFEDRVLKCNPILEAFGNGKTVRATVAVTNPLYPLLPALVVVLDRGLSATGQSSCG